MSVKALQAGWGCGCYVNAGSLELWPFRACLARLYNFSLPRDYLLKYLMYRRLVKLLRGLGIQVNGLRPGRVAFDFVVKTYVLNVTSERSKKSKESTWKFEFDLEVSH